MAFPTVASTSGGNRATNATSHDVTLPGSIASGDLLIVTVVFDGNPAVTWPAGWTALHAGVSASSLARIEMRYRIATGSESSPINFTTDVTEMFCYTCLRITGWHGTTPPESSAGTTGTSTAPNPDSLTPSWGSVETLWIAGIGYDQGQRWISADIASYTAHEKTHSSSTNQRADASAGCGVGIQSRAVSGASEDPGAATLSTSQAWRAFTVAVRPAVALGSRSSVIVAA